MRPEYQIATGKQVSTQVEIETDEETALARNPSGRRPWPSTLPEQVKAVAEVLAATAAPVDEDAIAAAFTGRGPWKKRLPQLLDTLVAMGRARQTGKQFSSII